MEAGSKQQRGSILGLIVVMVAVAMIAIVGVEVLIKHTSKQTNYLVWRDRLSRTANEGYIQALSRIKVDPTLGSANIPPTTTQWGTYEARAGWVRDLDPGTIRDRAEFFECGYVIVTASLTTSGAPTPRSVELKTVFRNANAGRFYGASKGRWMMNFTADNAGGSYYGRDFVLWSNGTTKVPKVGKIYYTETATMLDPDAAEPFNPISLVPGTDYPQFVTSDASAANYGRVNKLDNPPIFPELGPDAMARLKNVATNGTYNSYFNGNTNFPADIKSEKGWANTWPNDVIYPPGCPDATCNSLSNDDLKNHVYYVNGDLNIQGVVYGQVIFVATGKIVVTGDLVSDSLTFKSGGSNPDNPDTPYPGCPSPCLANTAANSKKDASNAHQAILMTPSGEGIKLSNDPAPDLDIAIPTTALNVEAMVLAPNSGYTTTAPTGPAGIEYIFKGSIIVGTIANQNLRFIPTSPPHIKYMDSLSTRPPPYIPGFTELVLWHEEYH